MSDSAVSRLYWRVSSTRIYDWSIRVIVAGWFGWTAFRQLESVVFLTAHAPHDCAVFAVSARLSSGLFFAFLACLMLFRDAPVLRSQGFFPRAVALCGTLSFTLVTYLPPAQLSPAAQALAAMLGFAAWSFAIYVVRHLSRAYSTMPEARRLVTSGPYRYVRHPLYLAEAVAMTGILLQFLSLPAVLLFAIQCSFQFLRMLNEERVLRCAFPNYADYAARTARLIPGVY